MDLVQGVYSHKTTAATRYKKLQELISQKYSFFAFQKNKSGDWAIYAANKPGGMYWQGLARHLKMQDNAVCLQRTESGFYGFALKNGLLEDEWITSTLVEYQIAQAYLNSQVHKSPVKYDVYLCDFDSNDSDGLVVNFDLPDSLVVNRVTLDDFDFSKFAKLKLISPKELRKKQSNPIEVALLGLIFIVISGFCAWLSWSLIQPKDVVTVEKKQTDPYEGLKKTLTDSGINVKGRMVQLYLNMKQISEIKGWKATTIEMVGNSTSITIERTWGDWSVLKEQAKKLGYDILMLGGKYQLIQEVRVNAVMENARTVPKISGTISYLKDGIAYYWPQKIAIREEAGITNNAWKQTKAILTCQGVHPGDMDNMASLINGWPITFEKATFIVADDGSLNGEVVLQVLGGA